MDLYSTNTLTRIVRAMDYPVSPLLDLFFPLVQTDDTEEIHFDVEESSRRLSPFVSPLIAGKIMKDKGYITKTFAPAYVKDKRIFDPNKNFKRVMGEKLTGSLTPAQREKRNLAASLADQMACLTRRQEWMAAHVMLTAKLTIEGEGYEQVELDFGRDAALTVDISGGAAEWGDTGVSALETLEDVALLILQKSHTQARIAVMDIKAWKLFRKDEDVQKILDVRRIAQQEAKYVYGGEEGLAYMGLFGVFHVFVYNATYEDEAGDTQDYMPDYTVIMGSPAMEGTRCFGAIKDYDAGLQPMEYFPKSWVEKDPSQRLLLMQSAPLVVPYRPDACACITVKAD